MKTVCIYCGSSPGESPIYADTARELGTELAGRGLRLVYGGASVGLMGVVADAVLDAGGEVVGVIPSFLKNKEVAHDRLTEVRVVGSMHERKAVMADLSDAFVALPGGLGTLDEMMEILTWAQLGMHGKPCVFLNVVGYYDLLIEFLDQAVASGFLRAQHRSVALVANNVSELFARFSDYRPPAVTKWLDRERT